MSALLRRARRFIRKSSAPRQFPTNGFEVIGSSCLVEEENWEWYKPEEFYPVRIGEIFQLRYQVVGKLGMAHIVPPGYAATYCTPLYNLHFYLSYTQLGTTNTSR
jgi:hypothetical protein